MVKSGRTHLMDATPVMLGQELGGYAAAVRYGIERLEASLPRVAELPLGGTAVGTGINTPQGFAAKVIAELARRDRAAVHRGPQPLRGAGRPRRAGRAVRAAEDDRGRADQALQRPALDVVGAADRAGRDRPAGPAAGLEHHAGQGQPGAAGGDADGLRPGDRQRRHGDRRGRQRQLRAQRDDAGARAQPAGVGPAAVHQQPAAGRPLHRRHHRQRRPDARPTPSRHRRW